MGVEGVLRLKGLQYEKVSLIAPHAAEMQRIYGEGQTTVPGLLIDGEPVHGSRRIFARLEELKPTPSLYPTPIAEQVRAAEIWGDGEFQDLGRRLPWGALHFRPEMLGALGGAGPLDGPGTDYAMRYIHATWKYHKLTAARLAEDLAGFPEKIAHIQSLIDEGVIGGDEPNAADFQIGATLRVMLVVGDLHPLLSGAPEALARKWFPDYAGLIPAGAYPAGWVPARS
jgi:glutathione S-transferase